MSEDIHPYLCFQHGGSEACEKSNKENGLKCPKCLPKGRKIDLNPDVYCPQDVSFVGGIKDCDHDYEQNPSKEMSTYASWVCTRCGGILYVGIWS